ncbi:MAG: bifunctional (p)ppGpp synthetase/guanosine-3',5'-bis(diphosphate) 3'-pyrophosphohydrolase [Bacteroidales bacterium]|nr:bifunctional (p)ppGpp synthetase/guanosine-3',5'-bis(diphosphate) 3'-pyrophosphohydrolase [Bacteroidales bacterium]
MKNNYQIQDIYQKAIAFAAEKHQTENQLIPGTQLPYVVHLSNVAMEILCASFHSPEFNLSLAVSAALLHDILEDTKTNRSELENKFGYSVADAVEALTKNTALPKSEKMIDCLTRIKKQPREVWAIKMADRITNLQKPPVTWDLEKKSEYCAEAKLILDQLGEGNEFLAQRLSEKIDEYSVYLK